jgi:hypothetical protein
MSKTKNKTDKKPEHTKSAGYVISKPKLVDPDSDSLEAREEAASLADNYDAIRRSLSDPHELVRAEAARNTRITESLLLKALKDKSSLVLNAAVSNLVATEKVLLAALDLDNIEVAALVVEHFHVTSAVLNKAAESKFQHIRRMVATSPKAPAQALLTLIDDSDVYTSHLALKNKRVPAQKLQQLVQYGSQLHLSAIAENPALTSDLIGELLKTGDHDVRATAIKHKNVTLKQAVDSLDDDDFQVRWAASIQLQVIAAKALLKESHV